MAIKRSDTSEPEPEPAPEPEPEPGPGSGLASESASERERETGPGSASDDERWLVVNGRRWRRTDPSLPAELVERLKSHLGRGRSGVGAAKRRGDEAAVASARERVGLAKHGLGERGPRWWEEPEAARLERATAALAELDSRVGH